MESEERLVRRAERGQSLVEFGLILPVLLFLTVGLMDAGQAIFAYNSVVRAAREGARYGAVYGGSQHPEFPWALAGPANGNTPGTYAGDPGPLPLTANGLPTIVGAVLRGATGLDAKELTVKVECPSNCTARSPLIVTVTYKYRPLSAYALNGGAVLNLTSVARVTVE